MGCESPFQASLKEHHRGNAKYCSRGCATRHIGQRKTERSATLITNTRCSTCGTPLRKPASRIKQSKTGHFFCNRTCKELAQRVGAPTSIPDIHPNRYGTGHTFYRKLAIRAHGCSCQVCGYDTYPALIHVHHIDRNHSNRNLENLRVLCIRCHMEDHFDAGDGPFSQYGQKTS